MDFYWLILLSQPPTKRPLQPPKKVVTATGEFVAPLLRSRRLVWRRQGIVLGIDHEDCQ
jgi:hypothetical protein